MKSPLDEALQKARLGDERGYSAIYVELAHGIKAFAQARSSEDPEGLTNEVFLAAFRNLQGFTGDADSLRGWIFTIARNKTIDDARRRSRRPQVVDAAVPDTGVVSVEVDVLAHLEEDWVREQLASLTADQREVLELRLVADLTIAEISRIVDKPIDAVKALQRRALRRLGKQISDRPYPSAHERR